MNENTDCRAPWKVRYAAKSDAIRNIKDMKVNKHENRKVANTLCAYPCGDHWHVGHDKLKRRPMAS